MDIQSARYEPINPGATGPEAIARAFENQVAYCRDNGAPVTASVCQALGKLIEGERGGAVMARVRRWAGPPLADALPLRVAGGLHGLHLSGEGTKLDPIYAGHTVSNHADIIADVIEQHEAFLLPWLDSPPQTNEAGRSSSFAAALLWLAGRGCPPHFGLNEIGSSAGINLMMGHYHYELGGVSVGSERGGLQLVPEWRGERPPSCSFDIVAARGCDVAPLDLVDPMQALRLRAYIWPEFTERFARLDAAIKLAQDWPPAISQERGADFVDRVLAEPAQEGVTRVIMHSVVWQYIPADERDQITRAIAAAGERASLNAPLAWISLEANRDTHRHELTIRYWPCAPEWTTLATAHPHGAWIDWAGR